MRRAVNRVGQRRAELDQPKEIVQPKAGAPGGQGHKGIDGGQARPAQRQRAQVRVVGEEHDAPLAPILADAEHVKLPPVPGMEGMGDRENLVTTQPKCKVVRCNDGATTNVDEYDASITRHN